MRLGRIAERSALSQASGEACGPERRSDLGARSNACEAALDIRDTIERFNERHAIPLRTRIGLHVGKVAMGPVARQYQVIGDVPNTASRIEGLNKQLGTTILASDARSFTDRRACVCERIGRFVLTGRSGELAIVEIVGRRAAVDQRPADSASDSPKPWPCSTARSRRRPVGSSKPIAAAYPSDGPARFYQHLCSSHAVAVPGSGPPVIRIDLK